jgi:hypothetical protein
MDDQVEEYYDDEDDEEEGPFRRWGVVVGIGVGVVCLGLIIVLWFGRNTLLKPLAELMASATPTATMTVPPPTLTATFTQAPTQPSTATFTIVPPTAAPATASEIMSLVSGPAVLEEQFADNSRAWTGVGQDSDFTIQEGALTVRSKTAGLPAMVFCSGSCGPYKDFYYYEAELYDERNSEFGHGLVFALNGQKNAYYVYKLRQGKGEYGLFKFTNGALVPLIDWTAVQGVAPAPQTNLMGVAFAEKTITLYLNGNRINTFTDNNPYTEGQIGFAVDQDGVRLMANRVSVYELLPRTPEAPSQLPTGQAPPPIVGAPTQTVKPTQAKFTPTPTREGSCPSYVPEDQWLLVVTKTDQNRNSEIQINGTTYELRDLNTPFYLLLDVDYSVNAGNKSYSYNMPTCRVVYIRVK